MSNESVVIRLADGVDDIIEIHRFLCLVSGPALRAPLDPLASIDEVERVVNSKLGVVAEINAETVGTIGLVKVAWWYSPAYFFLTDRFFFTYPALWHRGVGAALLGHAAAIGTATGLEIVINGHSRLRGTRSDRRGIRFTKPVLVAPGASRDDIAAASAAVLQ